MTIFVTVAMSFNTSIDGTSPHIAGPNCWNGAMVSLDLVYHYRFMHPDEFLYLTNTYCTEVNTPSKGSLGRMYDEKEVHAYIWVDESIVYAKHSDQAYEAYKFMNISQVSSTYFIKRECALDKIKNKSCFRKTAYYECKKEYGSTELQIKNLIPIDEKLYQLLFGSETKLSFEKGCNLPSMIKRNQLLLEIKNLVDNIVSTKIYDIEYLKTWIKSLKEQIYLIEVNSRAFRCRTLTYDEKYRNYRELNESINKLLNFLNSSKN